MLGGVGGLVKPVDLVGRGAQDDRLTSIGVRIMLKLTQKCALVFLAALVATIGLLAVANATPKEQAGTQTVSAGISIETMVERDNGFVRVAQEEVCVGGEDLIAWMRSPPKPMPSAEIFLTLTGEQATAFLQVTGGSALATEERTLYLVRAPVSHPGQIRVAAADAEGCLIGMDGSRTSDLSAEGFAGAADSEAVLRTMLEKIGVPWPETKLHPHQLAPVPADWSSKLDV